MGECTRRNPKSNCTSARANLEAALGERHLNTYWIVAKQFALAAFSFVSSIIMWWTGFVVFVIFTSHFHPPSIWEERCAWIVGGLATIAVSGMIATVFRLWQIGPAVTRITFANILLVQVIAGWYFVTMPMDF
jgi:hypothetical protein